MSPWWLEEKFPKRVLSDELIKETLVLDPENPPEKTSFAGMMMVFCKKVNAKIPVQQWEVIKVMMTEQDMNTAIDCMLNKKTFTYEKSENDRYAKVVVSPKTR